MINKIDHNAHSTGTRPLFYVDDLGETTNLIQKIVTSKRHLDRPTRTHIKYQALNYYPTRGIITIDGEGRYEKFGPDAFWELIESRYPSSPAPRVFVDPGQWPMPVIELTLDYEESKPGDGTIGSSTNIDAPPW